MFVRENLSFFIKIREASKILYIVTLFSIFLRVYNTLFCLFGLIFCNCLLDVTIFFIALDPIVLEHFFLQGLLPSKWFPKGHHSRKTIVVVAEADTGDILRRKVFLKIFQKSQKNVCARTSFIIELQAETCNFIKKETLTLVFSCEFWEKLSSYYRCSFSTATKILNDFY